MAQLLGNSFPASRIATESCRSCRLLRMTGSTISPHCTQRFAANSVSPMQKSKSIQKSVTMSPPHLVHVDSYGTEEETLWLPRCSAFDFSVNALAMISSIGFVFNVCIMYV
jgi:hypothetical protein